MATRGRGFQLAVHFAKYQALGNDYLVIEQDQLEAPLSAGLVRAICDRHFGVGADGILLAGPSGAGEPFSLRILNPDGSEAEKSGNGLRIYARYLFDRERVGEAPFTVETPGGAVSCRVLPRARLVSVEMGRVSFRSSEIPVAGPDREVLREPIEVAGRSLEISAATLGNPHCVVILAAISTSLARELGPKLENHPLFPRRTNVQLVQVIARHALRLEIWERGAGYTLASGTSSCAAAAVCHRLGLCGSDVTVHMPGGDLGVEVDPDFRITLLGPAQRVAEGSLSPEWLRDAR